LVERPHILRLANQMLDAKKASPDFVPDIFSSDGTGPLSVGVLLWALPGVLPGSPEDSRMVFLVVVLLLVMAMMM